MASDKTQWIIVTDLDGSLLNHHDYHWYPALPSIRQLQQQNIPIIFNTSKTYKETLQIQQDMDISAPFIVENGSCIFLPKEQFNQKPDPLAESNEPFWCIPLGKSANAIDQQLENVITDEDKFIKLSNCTPREAIKLTGLTNEQAKNAIEREFSQPIIWQASEEQLKDFTDRLHKQELNTLQGGRFLHIQGMSDKGKANNKIKDLYPNTKVIAIGDSANDIAMLEQADFSVVIHSPGNQYLLNQINPHYLTKQHAPEGWNEAIQYALGAIKQE